MMDLCDVLTRLTPEGLVEIWRHTWGVGGPHNRGPINMAKLEALSHDLQSLSSGVDPSVPAGKSLHAITFGRPFWDCNKRTGWFVCFTIMSSAGYALAKSDEEVERLVLDVEEGRTNEAETIEAVRKAFTHHLASKRQRPGRSRM